MAKFLDREGLSHLWGIIKNYVAKAISTKVDNTTTVNGHPLSGNVTVTKEDVGLGYVTNGAQVLRSEMGAKSGVAQLDSSGKVPSSQLPSYVDDVLEYASKSAFPTAGETGKIYVSTNDNKTWRWTGTTYVEISQGVTLGETSSTAYAGDKGKALNDKVESLPTDIATGGVTIAPQGLPSGMTGTYNNNLYIRLEQYEKGSNGQWGIKAISSSIAKDGTLIPVVNTGAKPNNGLMSVEDKKKLDGIAEGANKYTHPTTSGNKHIPAGGSSGQILRWASDGTAMWGADNNTTYSAFKGATSEADGAQGLVPAPAKGNQGKYLRGDGTWQTPPDTKYTLPTATSSVLGGVKLGSDTAQSVAANSVTSTAKRTYTIQKNSSGQLVVNVPWTDNSSAAIKDFEDLLFDYTEIVRTDGDTIKDAVYLTIKCDNGDGTTVFNSTVQILAATTSKAGVMTAADRTKLNGIAIGATADGALSTTEIDQACAN